MTDEAVPGSVEVAVKADLARLRVLDTGARATLAQMALRMARAYDEYKGADLTKLARLNQELRQTLQALMEEVGGDDDGADGAHLSTPVRDAALAGASDVGAAVGGGGGAAG